MKPPVESNAHPAACPSEASGRSGLALAGCVLAGLAVLLGAFGAHALENYLTDTRASEEPERVLKNWDTAVRFQMFHALGLIVLGWRKGPCCSVKRRWSGICFLAGIALFSGGLYVWAMTGWGAAVSVVPVGGMVLVVGWALAALMAWSLH